MKKFSIILVLAALVLPMIGTAQSSKFYFNKPRNLKSITIGVETGILRRTLVSSIDFSKQKFLDLGYRVTLSRRINKKVSLEFAAMSTLDRYGIFKDNSIATDNYFHVHKNRMLSINAQYYYMLGKYISLHPSIGFGWMQYKQVYQNDLKQDITTSKSDQLIMVGLSGKLHISTDFALGGSVQYVQSVDALKDKGISHVYLNTPFASAGMFITLPLEKTGHNAFRTARKCPKRF